MDATALTTQVLILVALFVIFYLTLVRPQQIKLRRHQRMLDNLRPGDRISTHGGLVGTIVNTNQDGSLTLEIAPNVHVVVTRKGIDERWPAHDSEGVERAATVGESAPSLS